MAEIKREIAVNCKINDLLNGEFIKTEGWNPSYFSTEYGNISRANIIGVVVNKEKEGIFIDDGSGRILLRSFENTRSLDYNIGDVILVVGRPRIYADQKYIMPEIVNKVDQKWGVFWRLRLEKLRKNIKKIEIKPKVNIKEEKEDNYFQKILNFIKDLDDGSGADVGDVVKRSNISNAENIIQKLIEEGEIFEIKPGKLKVLE